MSEAGGPWGGGMLMTPMGATSGEGRSMKEMEGTVNNFLSRADEYRKAGLQAQANQLHWLGLVEQTKMRMATMMEGKQSRDSWREMQILQMTMGQIEQRYMTTDIQGNKSIDMPGAAQEIVRRADGGQIPEQIAQPYREYLKKMEGENQPFVHGGYEYRRDPQGGFQRRKVQQ
jgi:hypothetical protein